MSHFGQLSICAALLVPLAGVISYYDIRYRRIPNVYVLITLLCGVAGNTATNGWRGALGSLGGCLFAFCLMLILHIFGAMGAGDVKLFASIGAVIGTNMVLSTFLIVLITGGALAVFTTLRSGTVYETAQRVSLIFSQLFTSWQVPRFVMPADRKQTIPYGVAITLGSLISLVIFQS